MIKRFIFLAAALLVLSAAFLSGYRYRTAGSSVAALQVSAASGQTEPDTSDDVSSSVPGTVRLGPERQQIAGIRLVTVKKNSETHTLRVLGRVAADETRIYQINAAVDGWIRRIFNNSTGSLVKKDEPLASFYSPEFLTAEKSFIYILGSVARQEIEGREATGSIDLTAARLQQYTDTLRNLGMNEIQIEEIARTRKLTQDIEIRSPAPGFVVARNISPGQRFAKGTELYRIADLRRVWIIADIFENEAGYLKPGKTVKISLPQQKKTFTATVSSVLPQFDPSTRSLKVRLVADNPGYILRPDMFVDVELPVTFPPAIAVPADAVLDSGLKKTVFVSRGNGLFEPRQVETGWRFGNRIEIARGLEPGEQIVISGNFLIDSESKMELAAAGMYGTLNKDPVSGVDVSVRKAGKEGRMSVYRGKTYYFASLSNKQEFDRNPDHYSTKELPTEDDQPCH